MRRAIRAATSVPGKPPGFPDTPFGNGLRFAFPLRELGCVPRPTPRFFPLPSVETKLPPLADPESRFGFARVFIAVSHPAGRAAIAQTPHGRAVLEVCKNCAITLTSVTPATFFLGGRKEGFAFLLRRLLKTLWVVGETFRESGLQTHPLLSLLESIRFPLGQFVLCPWRARYLEAFRGFHDAARSLAQFPHERRVVPLDGFHRVA